MAEKEKKPKIRFKGFTDEWKEYELGKLGKAQSGIGFPDKEQGGLLGLPFYKVSDMNNYGNEHEMSNANNYVTDEQIALNKWKPVDELPAVIFAKVGAAIMLNRKRLVRFPFLLDNNTMAYKFDNSWDIDFGKTIFEKIDLTSLAQVGALPSFNAKDVENLEIRIPKKEEQKCIGIFFKHLDNLITLHQRKHDKLAAIKKSMLEKMFPKDGVDVPEIRFKGFTDPWEQREIGNVVQTIGTGKSSFTAGICKSDKTPYAVLGSTSIIGYDSEFDYSGDFILTARVGENAGNLYKYAGNVKISDNTVFIQAKSIDFVFYLLSKFSLKRLSFGTGQPLIKASELSGLKLLFPQEENEQIKIGEYFNQLDNLLTLRQRELENLKNIKKACLEKMFV